MSSLSGDSKNAYHSPATKIHQGTSFTSIVVFSHTHLSSSTQDFFTQLFHKQFYRALSHTTFSRATLSQQLFDIHFFLHNLFETTDPPASCLSFLPSPYCFNHCFWLLEEVDLWGYPVLLISGYICRDPRGLKHACTWCFICCQACIAASLGGKARAAPLSRQILTGAGELIAFERGRGPTSAAGRHRVEFVN